MIQFVCVCGICSFQQCKKTHELREVSLNSIEIESHLPSNVDRKNSQKDIQLVTIFTAIARMPSNQISKLFFSSAFNQSRNSSWINLNSYSYFSSCFSFFVGFSAFSLDRDPFSIWSQEHPNWNVSDALNQTGSREIARFHTAITQVFSIDFQCVIRISTLYLQLPYIEFKVIVQMAAS